MRVTPKTVLIFATGNLLGIARFPKSLHEAGFKVAALCPPECFISKTRYVSQVQTLRAYRPSLFLFDSLAKDLAKAIADTAPNLVIPGDERAIYCLHQIVRLADKGQLAGFPEAALAVIKFSLCDPRFYEATNNKNTTQGIARTLGIRVPEQFEISNETDALEAAAKLGYPLVLKKGIGEAGLGVRICQSETELLSCLKLPLFREPSPTKQMIRRLLGREVSWVPNNEALALQRYVAGHGAVHCIAALEGKILGGYTTVKDCIYPKLTGQATRIRFINQPEIADAIAKFVAHTRYTGFGDFDFIIDEKTSLPYFLECNPRPSALFHLGASIGIDLAQAMLGGLSKQIYAPAPSVDESKVIVLFPQEWRRDPQSPHLASKLHDVPWDDPLLVKAYLQSA